MNDIKAIGFDFGGVIVEFAHTAPSVAHAVAEILNLTVEEVRTQYHKVNDQANVYNQPYQKVWAGVATSLGKPEKSEQVAELITAMFQFNPNPKMLELLQALKPNYKLGLLSNNTTDNAIKIRQQGLDKYFDAFLISGEIGYQKPYPEAFNLLFKALDVAPNETIFIDDSPNSLRLSDQIGYRPILFQNYEQLTNDLTNLGIKL